MHREICSGFLYTRNSITLIIFLDLVFPLTISSWKSVQVKCFTSHPFLLMIALGFLVWIPNSRLSWLALFLGWIVLNATKIIISNGNKLDVYKQVFTSAINIKKLIRSVHVTGRHWRLPSFQVKLALGWSLLYTHSVTTSCLLGIILHMAVFASSLVLSTSCVT